MTREEAIRQLDGADIAVLNRDFFKFNQAIIMAISALRQQETVTNRNVLNEPTNADCINAMTIEEKAEFLSSIAYGRETPWCEQFAEKFCEACPVTKVEIPEYLNPLFLHECDFTDGKCPHGEDIAWWLQQPAGEEDKHEPN